MMQQIIMIQRIVDTFAPTNDISTTYIPSYIWMLV